MFRAKLVKKGLVATVAAGGLLFAIAGPASAVTVGAGAGDGWEYPGNTRDCMVPAEAIGAEFASSTFELDHVGTYVAAPAAGAPVPAAEFAGFTTMTITVAKHVAGPLGVMAGGCSDNAFPGIPGPVGVTDVHIESVVGPAPNVGSVTCDMADPNGTYVRVSSAVAFAFDVQCDISGPTGTASGVTVTHVVEGTLNPCIIPASGLFPLLPDVPNPECDAAALVNPPTDDPGGHAVTAYEAVAV